MALRRGTTTIVATPHVEQVDVRELPDRVEEVRQALAREDIDLRVEVGGEIKPPSVWALDEEELEIVAHGPAGARWVLYEVPFAGVDDEFLAGALELRERGYGLLMAHPERSRGLLDRGLSALGPEIEAGARFAVNTGTITAMESEERHAAALHLLDRDLVAVVATDAHPPRRPYQLADAQRAVARHTGDARHAGHLVTEAPARLLRDGWATGASRGRTAA
jgi:protein-tyrosine phosphatase